MNDTGEEEFIQRISYDPYGLARHHRFGDLDGDGDTDNDDYEDVMVPNWGGFGPGDLNRDGTVDTTDMLLLDANLALALPFGQLSDSVTDNIVGFDGYLMSAYDTAYLARNRFYEPDRGRFINRDPAGYADGMSMYEYGMSSPFVYTDPLGLQGAIANAADRHASHVNQVMSAFRAGRISGSNASRLINESNSGTMSVIRDAQRVSESWDFRLQTSTIALGNAAADTIIGFGSLGFYGSQGRYEFFTVSEYQFDAGYRSAYLPARVATEVASALVTMRFGGSALFSWDMAGNVVAVGRGGYGMATEGITFENSMDVIGGLAGVGGGLGRAIPCPSRYDDLLTASRKGPRDFGIGTGTATDAARLGRQWVGSGYRIASDGKTLVSKNGLRQYRPPSYKRTRNQIQANFQSRSQSSGPWTSNGHLDIEK